jgi:hypothetical protein
LRVSDNRLTKSDLRIGLAAVSALTVVGFVTSWLYAPAAVGVTVGCAVAAVLIVARRWKNTLFHDLNESLVEMRRDLRVAHGEIEETRALVALQEPRFAIPLPWSNWALPPRGLLEVLKTVQQFESPTVVDCGSGVSTLHLARAIREIGRGRVIALEQDADWATYIQRMLERNGLESWAKIVVAPVESCVICDRQTAWYTLPDQAIAADTRIDIVVVDGPRGRDGEVSRLGALPRLWDRLSERGAVFLDDTNRPDEQEICRVWRERYPVVETGIATEHGMSKFTRRAE